MEAKHSKHPFGRPKIPVVPEHRLFKPSPLQKARASPIFTSVRKTKEFGSAYGGQGHFKRRPPLPEANSRERGLLKAHGVALSAFFFGGGGVALFAWAPGGGPDNHGNPILRRTRAHTHTYSTLLVILCGLGVGYLFHLASRKVPIPDPIQDTRKGKLIKGAARLKKM